MSDSPAPKPPRTWKSIFGGAVSVAAACIGVLVALLLSVWVHAHDPLLKRAVVDLANAWLEDALYGKVEIEDLSEFSLSGFSVSRATLTDEQGNPVIEIEQAHFELDLMAFVADALFGDGSLDLVVEYSRVERSVVRLVPDPTSGETTLSHALTPRPSASRKPGAAKTPARPFRVYFPVVELGLGEAKFALPGWEQFTPVLGHVRGKLLFSPKGIALDVERFGATAEGLMGHSLRGTGTFGLRAPGPLDLDFTGFLDEAEVRARAQLAAGKLTLALQAPRLQPSTVKSWYPAWPVEAPLAAQITASGQLPKLDVHAQVEAETSELDLDGLLDLKEGINATLRAELKHLDLGPLIPGAPTTDLTAGSDIGVSIDNDGYEATASGNVEPTQIAAVEVPAIDFEINATREHTSAALTLHEPGAPINATADYAAGKLTAEIETSVPNLASQRRVRRLGLPGQATRTALHAKLELDDQNLETELEADIAQVGIANLKGSRLHVEAKAKGRPHQLDELQFNVMAHADNLQLGPVRFSEGRLSLQGSQKSFNTKLELSDTDGRSVTSSGHVDDQLVVTNADFVARQGEIEVRGKARRIAAREPSIDVPQFTISGPSGTLEGRVVARPGLFECKLDADSVRIERVLRALGIGDPPARGNVSLHADVSLGHDVQKGRLDADLDHVSVAEWGDSKISIWSTLDGKDVQGALQSNDALGFALQAKWGALLGGPALELASWQSASGDAEISLIGVPLESLPLVLGSSGLQQLDGTLGARVLLQRTATSGFPDAFIELGSNVATLTIGKGAAAEKLEHLTAYYSGAFSAAANKLNGSVLVADQNGTLLSATSAFDFEPAAWFDDPSLALANFRQQPLNVVVNLPEHTLASLPLMKNSGLGGSVSGQAAVYGSLDAPRVSLLMSGHSITTGLTSNSAPFSFGANANVDLETGELQVEVGGETQGRRVLTAKLDGTVPFRHANASTWRASVALDHLPLGILEPLAAYEFAGKVSGDINLEQGAQPRLQAKLEVENLSSGRSVLGNGSFVAIGKPGEVRATFAASEGPHALMLQVTATAPLADVPLPAEFTHLDAGILAKQLDAAALAPLLGGLVARPAGDVDVDFAWTGERHSVASSTETQWTSELSGSARLSHGTAYVEGLGIELRDIDVEAKAVASAGKTRLSIQRFEAKARSEKVNVNGNANLLIDGFVASEGAASFALQSVPMTLEGLNLGRASGKANARFQRRHGWNVAGAWQGKDYVDVGVSLDKWRLKASPAASRELIDLGRNSDIVVLQSEVSTRSDAEITPYRFVIDLGSDTEFSLADLEVPLGGKVQIEYTNKSKLRGTLLPRGGRIPIFGRVFEIVDGKVILNPKDPSNPDLDLTLSGRSNDDDVIYIHIGGTLKEPITDPSPTALQPLLGGGAASVLGSGVQALGVSQLLGESVQLRVSSADEKEEETNYTAAVRIDDDLWFEANYQRGQASSLTQEDTDAVSGSIDYRFKKRWSVRTKVGNTGGSVDLLWQYRY